MATRTTRHLLAPRLLAQLAQDPDKARAIARIVAAELTPRDAGRALRLWSRWHRVSVLAADVATVGEINRHDRSDRHDTRSDTRTRTETTPRDGVPPWRSRAVVATGPTGTTHGPTPAHEGGKQDERM